MGQKISIKFEIDKGSCKALREKQFHMGVAKPNKGSTKINKGLIMSFYGVEELEELHKRYPTKDRRCCCIKVDTTPTLPCKNSLAKLKAISYKYITLK